MAFKWKLSGIQVAVKWSSHWLFSDESQVTSDWPSSGIGLTVKWYWIDSQVVSHWLSSDEFQVTSD